jgi:hypothetical protein
VIAMKEGIALKHMVRAAALLCAGWLAAHSDPVWAQRSPLLQNSRVDFAYVAPSDPYLRPVYERLKKRQVLEELRQFLAPLRLPRKLTLKTLQCQTTNAFYNPREVALNICYEYVDWIERLVPKETATPLGITPESVLVGGFVEVVLHETGHAVIDLLQIPVFGREEDAADQLAGFIMLQFGKDVARKLLTGTIFLYREQSKILPQSNFADVHGTDLQRFYNYACMAYGSDPQTFADLVDTNVLPKSRAENCGREYQQVKWAFLQAVAPFVDQDLLKIVQASEWLRPDDGK